ncbi:hypothetical protein [Spirillospora sp. CA-294931]|uniref:hypothetical protein n=1 Tax=Spirillospora sp. CA-294931 TaxID=3240042 RepID=UPI003D92F4D8
MSIDHTNGIGSEDATPLIPTAIIRAVLGSIDGLIALSESDPGAATRTEVTADGTVGVRVFGAGAIDPAVGWRGDLDWVALIVLSQPPTREIYIIPASHFTHEAFQFGGTLQHIDDDGPDQPGVFWVDLNEPAYRERHARLALYRIM